ncbi:AAA family ATPase, partial [candidate division GN15 bacterium]|nr:AAA family ATPase [candidate division GN15 bacterium]
IGTVVDELSELYRVIGEQPVGFILVPQSRRDLTQSVATRIRRQNALTEIWRLVTHEGTPDDLEEFLDGMIPISLGRPGIVRRIEQVLQEKALLRRYAIVGRSPGMKALARTINKVAATDVSVLIVGPSGSGKELVARAVHSDSSRAEKPFVAINCGALAEGLLESELFGHEKGAFTGSVGKRDGLFHKAEGGSIFLDEIGETTAAMQVKLLRVLEDGTYYPVGSSTPRRASVRIIAATNRDLTEAIADRDFREDLYFRVSAVKLIVPDLMNRRGDIQPLLHHFWKDHPDLDYSDSALRKLMQYDWPGNVRQLRNFATRMAALKPEGLVESDDVDKFLSEQHSTATHLPVSTGRTPEEAGQELIYRAILSLGNEIRMLRNLITANLPGDQDLASQPVSQEVRESGATMEEMEKALIEQMLAETGGNRKATARRLGIGERTLYRKLKKYGLK